MTTFTQFSRETINTLQAPITAYFDRVSAVEGKTGPFAEVQRTLARTQVRNAFKRAITAQLDRAVTLSREAGFLPSYADYTRIKDEQFAYADGFMDVLPDLTEDAALARSASYTPAILRLFTEAQADTVPPLPIYPGGADLICGSFCKCHLNIVTKAGKGNFDVYWVLGKAEHCPSCVSLSEQWNPLPIRDGKVPDGTRFDWKKMAIYDVVKALMSQGRIDRRTGHDVIGY